MADVTPPVGLASFAAAAVSKGDPIKTGVVAFYYSLRTAALPFLFIFNTDLLLIDVSFWHGMVIFVIATLAMLIFAAGTQGYFLVRSRWYENVLLLLIAFTLFRPGFWMDIVHDPYRDIPPTQLVQALEAVDEDSQLRLRIRGEDAVGDMREFSLLVAIPNGETGAKEAGEAGCDDLRGRRQGADRQRDLRQPCRRARIAVRSGDSGRARAYRPLGQGVDVATRSVAVRTGGVDAAASAAGLTRSRR
jgi:hypothetical protein